MKIVIDISEEDYERLKKYDGGYTTGRDSIVNGTPLPKGHWKIDIDREDKDRTWDWRRFYCSVCGDWQTYGETKYCMHCGAEMEVKDK